MSETSRTNEVVSNAKTEPLQMPNTRPEEVHYRVIADKELELLSPIFQRLGWSLPDPNMAKVVVAEIGQGMDALVCGFCVVQFIPHAEPMWLHPDLRGTGVAEGLIAHTQHYLEVDCGIKRYVSSAKPGSFAARLCEKYGMDPWPGQIFVRQIG